MKLNYIVIFTLLFSCSSFANNLVGKVTRVIDGDTIEVKTLPEKILVYEIPIRVRLINIDAPEKNNPLDAGQRINLKPSSQDNPLPSLIRKQIATGESWDK